VTQGDTTVVHTISGSEWGRAELVEELRLGRREGEPHEMFGRIGALAVTASGEILAYDAHANELRRYGADGSFRGTVGGAGSGPGEYRNVAGIGVFEDGRIVVNDFGNGRYNFYTAEGKPVTTWPVGPAIAELRPLYTQRSGGVFLHDSRPREGDDAWTEVLVDLDDTGAQRGVIPIPFTDYRQPALEVRSERASMGTAVPFTPTRGWSVTADGMLVAMLGNRYSIDVHRHDGSMLRITRHVEPVPVSPEERAAEQLRITRRFQRVVDEWRWTGPQIPTTKPPISWLHAADDSTIWVRIAQPGTVIPESDRDPELRTAVREAVVFDVFESTGRFLGQVRAPDSLQLQPHPVFSHDRVWAVVRDQVGVSFVVRYRIVRG
jgi:hypothetical protein